MSATPPDWVLLAARKISGWQPGYTIGAIRRDYHDDYMNVFRALCDMIAKYEQPPVDPDVEAVKRIIGAWLDGDYDNIECDTRADFVRAVAQYKLERGE